MDKSRPLSLAPVPTTIAWSGVPTYAARLLRPLVQSRGVTVIGSKARFEFQGLEENLGTRIHWLDEAKATSWDQLGLPVPSLFIHTGWNIPAFNSLAEEAVGRGAWRVPMIDNNWKGTFRQRMGAVVFPFLYAGKFDGAIVPGKAGVDFMRRMHYPAARVVTGMYGADPDLFDMGRRCSERPKRILFIGQFIERKGLEELVRAWVQSGAATRGWELRCFGSGPLEPILKNVAGVVVGGFAQAERLKVELGEARFLVLPSREEHWGVVVHEAALSGCALLVSSAVGAAADLVEDTNGIIVRPNDERSLGSAIERIQGLSDPWLDNASVHSRRLAEDFGPRRWLEMYEALVRLLKATRGKPAEPSARSAHLERRPSSGASLKVDS